MMHDLYTYPATAFGAARDVDGALQEARRRNRRSSYLAGILALVILLTLAGVLSAAGVLPAIPSGHPTAIAPAEPPVGPAAAPRGGASTPASDGRTASWDAVAHAEWDGPATHLDWSGRGYSTAESSFVGDRVATPGDSTRRTLLLTNDGPATAGLTVSLRLDEIVADDTRNPGLGDDVELFWNVGGVEGRQPYSELLERSADTVGTGQGRTGQVEIAQVRVAEGDTVAVEIGFELPAATTSQRNEGSPSTELAFDVVATLSGDADAQPQRLAATGAGPLLPFGIAAALLLLLGLLLFARPRRRCDDCSRMLGRDESWVDLREHGVGRYRVCQPCARLHLGVPRPDAGADDDGTTAGDASHH
ncbi:hypothetical protein [Microbacterium sp. 3J1]|uniref:hypothetical protein n=1 Tax=Microbacterium sp. 3J1 TaxID=861269 RepID=UPI000A5C7146|nr:hypothetical protein [Microbacterium sp. 3J1]